MFNIILKIKNLSDFAYYLLKFRKVSASVGWVKTQQNC